VNRNSSSTAYQRTNSSSFSTNSVRKMTSDLVGWGLYLGHLDLAPVAFRPHLPTMIIEGRKPQLVLSLQRSDRLCTEITLSLLDRDRRFAGQ
jgi:hypothetical protein